MSVVFPAGVFYTVMSFNEASEDLLALVPRYSLFLLLHVASWFSFWFFLSFSAALPYEGKCQMYRPRPLRSDASGRHRVAEVANRHRP